MRQELLTAAMVLVPVALVSFCSCFSPPKGPEKVETFQEVAGGAGFGGEVIVNSTTTNAMIVSLDAAQRKIALKYPDGSGVTYKAGPEIINFNQIKAGDQVQTTVTENFSLSVVGTGALPDPVKSGMVVQSSNELELGTKPVATVRFTGKIMALDYVRSQATLQLADGRTKTVNVRDAVNLGDVKVGDNVSVLITKAMTIVLEKP